MKTPFAGLYFFLCCAPLSVVAFSAAAAETHLGQVRIEGRTARGADGSIRLGFPGVTLHLRFRGEALALKVRASTDDVYFDVLVDQRPAIRLRALTGEGTYPLFPDAIGAGEHVVQIVRRSESWQGTVDVLAVEPGAGAVLLDPPPAQERRLLFIGDSVTSGEIAGYQQGDALNGKTRQNAHAANARLSYGYVLARQLKAEVHLVSYGGRGIIRDWQGIRDTVNAPQFYERALPDDASTHWNPADYVPDAIGVCLGTNDFNQGVPEQNEFVNAYVEFLRKLRRDAPHASIFLIESPIVNNAPGQPPKRDVLRGYLEQVIAKSGDARVFLGPIHHYPGLKGNGHPLAFEHAQMADELRPLFQRALDGR